MSEHSARQEAASLATRVIQERWRDEEPGSQAGADRINREYTQECLRIGILYPDVDLAPDAADGIWGGGTGWGPSRSDKPVCGLAIRRNR